MALLLFLGWASPLWAEETTPQPSVISLTLNGRLAVDMEILQWPDGSFSIPLKHTATLLDIPLQQSHQTHAITFTDPVTSDPVRIDVEKQMITHGDAIFDHLPHPILYVAQGLFSSEDLYLQQDLAEQFLGVKLSLEKTTQSVALSTTRPLKILLRVTEEANPEDAGSSNEESSLPSQAPDKTGPLLESVTLDLNSTTYEEIQRQAVFEEGQPQQTQYLNAGTSLYTGFKGHIGNLPYTFGPRVAYQNGQFGILDIKGKAIWERSHQVLEAGVLTTGLSPLISPNLPLWGLQWSSLNATLPVLSPKNTLLFEGKAPASGKVTLILNGSPYAVQRPKDHTYRFEDVPLQANLLNRIQITQATPEGEVTLAESSLPYYPQTLHAGEKAYSAFLGRAPFQFQPPGFATTQPTSLRLPQSDKWVLGGRYFYGLTDQLTLGISAAGDTVFGPPKTSQLGQLLNSIQIPDLTGYLGYRRDPNLLSGLSTGLSLIYRPREHWTLSADMGVGQKNNLGNNAPAVEAPLDLAGQIALLYQGKALQTSLKLFHYGADYYTPLTLGENNLYDRQGISLQTNGRLKGILYQLGVDHYLTNLASTIPEGIVTINRLNGSLYRRFNPKTDGRLLFSYLEGQNEARLLNVQNAQVEVNRTLPGNLRLRLAVRRSNNRYLFNPTNPLQLLPVQAQTQVNHYLETGLQVPLPNQAGTLQLGGNFSSTLGLVNLQGSVHWHGLRVEPIVQSSIWGEQTLFTLGMGLFYEWSQGRRVGIRYSYNYSTLPSVATTLGQSQRVSQQFQLDLNDTLALLAGHLTSLGNRGESTGILKGHVFLDLNKNGKQELGEPGSGHIPLLVDGKHVLQSDTKGRFFATQLSPGPHTVSYNLDQLPVNLSPTTPPATVKIAAGKTTSVAFGLIVTPGNLSGTLHLHDINGKAVKATDTILVLKDAQGKEVQFTYADEDGHYALSDVAPGTYTLFPDLKQVSARHLKVLTAAHRITVPVDYQNFYDKKGLDFDVIQLMQGPKGE